MEETLRNLIREILEEEQEDLEEFSGVAALGGGPMMPLGVDATYPSSRKKKKKKVNELNVVAGAVLPLSIDANRNGIPDNLESNVISNSLFREPSEVYSDSVECLARSFGGSKTPFKNKSQAKKFLRRDY